MIKKSGTHEIQEVNNLAKAIVDGMIDCDGDMYIGFPMFCDNNSSAPRSIDIMLATKRGVFLIDYLKTGSIDYTKTQDETFVAIKSKLTKYSFLVNGRDLFFEPKTITFCPAPGNDFIAANDGLHLFARTAEDLISCIKDNSIYDFSEEQYNKILTGLQGAYGIVVRSNRSEHSAGKKAQAIYSMEREVEKYDNSQMNAILTDPEGIQRIAGMAGSGKTIVLVRKAVEMHLRYPDWDIAITFNTRSLKNMFKKLIERFYRACTDGREPNYDKLHIMHAWGSSDTPGIYSYACSMLGEKSLSFAEARRLSAKDPFDFACGELLKKRKLCKMFDCIIIDEAQDFGKNFFNLCLGALDKHERLVYAYDELQNISDKPMMTPNEIFGKDIKSSTSLKASYRNQEEVIVSAHALGMGLYRKEGKLQMPNDPGVWDTIGYESDDEIKPGKKVVLHRTKETSPSLLNQSADELIKIDSFATGQGQTDCLFRAIENDFKDGVRNNEMIVVDMDSHHMRSNFMDFRIALDKLTSRSPKFDFHLAGDISPEDFYREGDELHQSIVYSGIRRAKGNEAYQVYIINAQEAFDDLNPLGRRNALFTAITRSKGWVRIMGVGDRMKVLEEEYQQIKNHGYQLFFDPYPTREEMENIVKNNRELTLAEESKAGRAIEDIKSIGEDNAFKLKVAMKLFGTNDANELIKIIEENGK